MHLPRPLPHDREPVVQIVAPSGPLGPHLERLEAGIQSLNESGFKTLLNRDLRSRNQRGYLGGGDHVRSKELLDALTNSDVDIVWWARGGSGAARIQSEVMTRLEQVEPKWLIGFSDATSLLNAISIELGWVTLHGPTVTLLQQQDDWNKALRGVINKLSHSDVSDPLDWDRPPLIYGGNITVLASLMGTVNLESIERHVLLFEDVNELPYRLDRCLTQIRQCWPTSMIDEIWLGDLDLEQHISDEIARYIEADFGCPVRRGVSAGHHGQLSFIPLGYSSVSK